MELQKYFCKGLENRVYLEKTFKGTEEEYKIALKESNTVYVGGLPENFKEERIWNLFLIVGPIKRIIMGINKSTLIGCGFCFVEFENSCDANNSTVFFKEFFVDGSMIKVGKDWGFVEGRQYGRGIFGGSAKVDSKKRRRFFN